jgi:hypothetical protein
VVPRVEREEFINAGVILYCRSRDFLAAGIALDRARLRALDPDPSLDVEAVERALALVARICAGEPGAGPIAALPQAERFRWLSATRSTVTQVSPVHAGLCDDPARTLELLMARVVQTG